MQQMLNEWAIADHAIVVFEHGAQGPNVNRKRTKVVEEFEGVFPAVVVLVAEHSTEEVHTASAVGTVEVACEAIRPIRCEWRGCPLELNSWIALQEVSVIP